MQSTTTAGLALSHLLLTAPPVHVPNGRGGAYKTELVVERDPTTQTVKILWWYEDDPRDLPHNHPWRDDDGIAFRSEILAGGYTEQSWVVGEIGKVHRLDDATYRAGDVNTCCWSTFHRVTDVLPGTVTRMTCGPAVGGNEWHYLDPTTGELEPSADPLFLAAFRELNPHTRPR